MYSNEIAIWDNEIYIGVKRPKKKIKKTKIKKIRKPAARGIDLEYCPWCDCRYQHRISAQHKRTAKHKYNFASKK
jgi:hypothetical protein